LTLLLLQAPLRQARPAPLAEGYQLRPSRPEDIDELGRLYFTAYDPGIACASEAEAIADIAASFAGRYGELWTEASPVIVHGESIVGAVQAVRAAPWPDVPQGPFISEVFVGREHRRRGLARAALTATMAALARTGETAVSLRVMASNAAARRLYASLGFRQADVFATGIPPLSETARDR
jgi:ribosomal protein S18 acetylase RimI-like enzyme